MSRTELASADAGVKLGQAVGDSAAGAVTESLGQGLKNPYVVATLAGAHGGIAGGFRLGGPVTRIRSVESRAESDSDWHRARPATRTRRRRST